MKKGRITGIGGIFFKCKDPKKVKSWYEEKFNLITDNYGALFEFRKASQPDKKGYLQWSPFSSDTAYFEPSEKEYMINYRVENLEDFLDQLKEKGVEILDEVEEFEYGKFVHVKGPEGQKIELWEPVDESFERLYQDKTNK